MDGSLYVRLGALLRAEREARGLTQGQLADRVGLTRTSVTNTEQGAQRIPLHVFVELCAALGASPGEVLGAACDGHREPQDAAGDVADSGLARWVARIVDSSSPASSQHKAHGGRRVGVTTR